MNAVHVPTFQVWGVPKAYSHQEIQGLCVFRSFVSFEFPFAFKLTYHLSLLSLSSKVKYHLQIYSPRLDVHYVNSRNAESAV